MSPVDPARLESGPPLFVEIPRPGGGLRRLTAPSPAQAAAYERAVARLRRMIERSLGPEVMANRTVGGPGVRLRPWRVERRRFDRARRAVLRRGDVILKVDVRACYPSITSRAVGAALIRTGASVRDVAAVRSVLDRFAQDGVAGLPIGPDPSAVLANSVLGPLDDVLRRSGAPHVRWVDDVWAAAADHRRAEEILDRIRAALSSIGLSLNEDKTRLLGGGEAVERLVAGSIEPYR